MTLKLKYPRTTHLPSSPGYTSDDIRGDALCLLGKRVVITEKLDGENTSLYPDGMHARSLDSRSHPSRDWLKRWWGERQYMLAPDHRICGENVYARHSIAYENLEGYFYGFSVWYYRRCLCWEDTTNLLKQLDVPIVPVLWEGTFKLEVVDELLAKLDLTRVEGLVVRLASGFEYDAFNSSVAKWVRSNHVQTDEHWMTQAVVPNGLSDACHSMHVGQQAYV